MPDWKPHFYRVGQHIYEADDTDDPAAGVDAHRRKIEPWLSAVFQSEHLSLLLGSGFTIAVAAACGTTATGMDKIDFGCALADKLDAYADASAKKCGRGKANIEDQIRAANQLIAGLNILGDSRVEELRTALGVELTAFLGRILMSEAALQTALAKGDEVAFVAESLLVSFLLSFASRASSRERLNLFTTNYNTSDSSSMAVTGPVCASWIVLSANYDPFSARPGLVLICTTIHRGFVANRDIWKAFFV